MRQVISLEEQAEEHSIVEERLDAELIALRSQVDHLDSELKTTSARRNLLERRLCEAEEANRVLEKRLEIHEGELAGERDQVSSRVSLKEGTGADVSAGVRPCVEGDELRGELREMASLLDDTKPVESKMGTAGAEERK